MAIPESQLETWSHQGSVTQSCETYNSIKTALESPDSSYSGKDYSIFLQGSYGNDTNIFSESDVDIVIRLNSCFNHDLESLPQDQRAAFNAVYPAATYNYYNFKKDVSDHLLEKYGDSVEPGKKAIKIKANGNRRSTDVLVTIEYRRYIKFLSIGDESYVSGICFHNSENKQIANYPKQHSDNLTAKHQATGTWFKPMVRILKNMRSKLVEDGKIGDGIAPSYYIEGLLYNVPNEMFGESYEASFVKTVNWLLKADRSKFVCANEQYYLLFEGSPVTWRASQCTEFLSAVCNLWKTW